jgi:hypothetical protein
MSQLRKSSSAASQLRKINKINYLRDGPFDAFLSLVSSVTCDAQAALDDVRNCEPGPAARERPTKIRSDDFRPWLRQCLSRYLTDRSLP